ncbi:hypothetical protein EYF80_055165 [Liparis tanakae]|uniref:Uncharacterized protein n=1 Tax=Liparis tanakae TaxID=230148 RepID=A0A4Z2F2F1_9TELE|nr:hypothetical protein EYF80_055165 [Liparis tanakae]
MTNEQVIHMTNEQGSAGVRGSESGAQSPGLRVRGSESGDQSPGIRVRGSEPGASGKDELQGRLDVPLGGLQRPQHQVLVLDAHVPELLHLGLPAALRHKTTAFHPQTGIHRLKYSTAHMRVHIVPQCIECVSLTCRADMLEACRACCRAWLKRSLLTGVPAGIGATPPEGSACSEEERNTR